MIRRITIKNFKSLRDVSVDLSPVTVLVGRSGSGKSNFLQGIEFLRDFVRANGESADLNAAYRPFAGANGGDGTADFTLQFSIPGKNDEFVYRFRIQYRGQQLFLLAESLSVGAQPIFEQETTKRGAGSQFEWKVAPPLVQPPTPGKLVIGKLPGLEEAASAYAVIATGIGVYRFPLDVMQPRVPTGKLSELDKKHLQFGLDDIGSNYLIAIQELNLRIDQATARKSMLATLQRLNKTIRSIELESLQELKGTIVAHTLADRVLPLRLEEESDGFRRFFAHLLALYQLPPKQVLLFEEPENGIYPGALDLLGEEFKSAPTAERGQVILTTHSPQLLDQFEADQIRVVELKDNLETVIGPLAADQRDAIKDHLLAPGELLDVDPARREVVAS